MSVLVYIENPNNHLKKTGFEAAYYAHLTAKSLGTDAIALVIGKCENVDVLGKYGVSKIIHLNASEDVKFDPQTYTSMITTASADHNCKIVLLAQTANGKSLAGRLGIRLNAGVVSGANSLPNVSNGFEVTKSVYSGKAIVTYKIETETKVVSIMGNTIQPVEVGNSVQPTLENQTIPTTKLKVLNNKTTEGTVPLPEAELVVSAGRGMKGPENWAIIDDLASVLGATTACSRPVADSDWRPHHEHVGQTGVAIRPNLYIAIGISGAIQHLAGVNNSKVIVVINKDPEAPFFKAADYGVVGDLFEVVPRLTEALKKYKHA